MPGAGMSWAGVHSNPQPPVLPGVFLCRRDDRRRATELGKLQSTQSALPRSTKQMTPGRAWHVAGFL